jgi:hypothetical protein
MINWFVDRAFPGLITKVDLVDTGLEIDNIL